ncbi:MAG: Gfo/Idh/MocA family oxidoreductase [Clostridia bacterium]|nr:Gfo/Idh/MocA family oxidoreductase [Clostridia bacterium]
MYKVAILGCENSHANAFIDIVYKQKLVDDVEFVGVYSDEVEAMQKLHDEFGVPMMERYDELVGKIDGLIVTARHGDNHYKYAKPYIESGIPMFIDKPITITESEAVEFMKDLKAHSVKVVGGSSCVHAEDVTELKAKIDSGEYGSVYGGFVRAPIHMENVYGGFFFYAQHLVQIMSAIFGYYPKSVKSYRNGNVITFMVRYENYDITAEYVDGRAFYAATVSLEKAVFGGKIAIADGNTYTPEFLEFHKILTGGAQPQSYREFIAPVYIMCAMFRSLESGEEEAVNAAAEI